MVDVDAIQNPDCYGLGCHAYIKICDTSPKAGDFFLDE